MKIFIGLGNIGEEYYKTRHNIGFLAIDKICFELGIELSVKKYNGIFFKGKLDGNDVIIAKPQTYMNNSGDFVKDIINFYKINPKDIIIIHDDKDIKFGKIKLSENFSGGSHNGVKNILWNLGIKTIKAIRIGIDNNSNYTSLKSFVLSEFTKNEISLMEKIFTNIYNIFFDSVEKSFLSIMNKYN